MRAYTSRTSSAMKRFRIAASILVLIGASFAVLALPSVQDVQHMPESFPFPLPDRSGPLRKALLLLREGKTAEARKELEEQRGLRPNDAEVLYQIARSHLIDFYQQSDPEKRRVSLALAMEDARGDARSAIPITFPPAREGRDSRARRTALLRSQPGLRTGARAWPSWNLTTTAFLLDLSSEWMSGRSTLHQGERPPCAARSRSSGWTDPSTCWSRWWTIPCRSATTNRRRCF